jgi:hypothetical protein
MENNDDRKQKLEQNFRHSVAALQTYCENRNNPMDGSPEFARLVNELFAAKDALASWG